MTTHGALPHRAFGATGISCAALGLGAGQIGDGHLDEGAVGALLNLALDLGVDLIDTARGYGLSEGQHKPLVVSSDYYIAT